jgi:hypothetical protein
VVSLLGAAIIVWTNLQIATPKYRLKALDVHSAVNNFHVPGCNQPKPESKTARLTPLE